QLSRARLRLEAWVRSGLSPVQFVAMLAKSTETAAGRKAGKFSEKGGGKNVPWEEDHLPVRKKSGCSYEFLLKACASGQEKPTVCHRNSAAPDAHIRHPRTQRARSQKKIAGTTDLHALADMHTLSGTCEPAAHQVGDCTSRGRPCRRILASVELHARSKLSIVLLRK